MGRRNKNSVNIDVAQRLDIIARRGDTFELTMEVTDAAGNDVDFSLFTDIVMDVRTTTEDTGTPVLEFTLSNFDTTNIGQLRIIKEAANMEVTPSMYVYDMELTDAVGKKVTWFYGFFKVTDDVTL